MDKDDTQNNSDFNIYEATSEILCNHGKSDEEIKVFLEEHFPISAAIIDKVLESINAKKKINHKSKFCIHKETIIIKSLLLYNKRTQYPIYQWIFFYLW